MRTTADSYSVRAILSAQDKGFSSALKGAGAAVDTLGSKLKSGLSFGVFSAVGTKAVNAVTGSLGGLVKEAVETSDSMQKLQQAMRFSGYSETEIKRIAGSTGTLKTYADKTVFSLEDVMSTFGALSANGIENADKLTESVGNAVAVFGGGAQEYSGVALAFSQAMAAGALHAQDWNQILNASPQLAGGLRKELIKLNPKLGKDFKGAMEEGAISSDLLGEAMNNIGMTEMAKEAATSVTTFEGAMGNLEATVSSGMMELYDSFAKSGVVDAINTLNEKLGSAFSWLTEKLPEVINSITPYWLAIKDAAIEVGSAFGDAFSAIGDSLSEMNGAFGSHESVKGFKSVLEPIKSALKAFARFLEDHAGIIAKLISNLPKLAKAFLAFKVAKTVAGPVSKVAGAIGRISNSLMSGVTEKLGGFGKKMSKTGKTSRQSAKNMVASGKAFVLTGVGILAVAAGFALLAKSAIKLAKAGPAAVGIMAGLVVAVAGLSFGMAAMAKSLTKASPAKLAQLSKVMLSIGGAIAAVVLSLALLALAVVPLASLGTTAVAPLVAFGVVVAGLAVVFANMGQKLQASVTGIVAFAAAISVMALAMTPLASTGTEGAIAMGAFGIVVAGLVAVFSIFGTALNAAIPGMLGLAAAAVGIGAGMRLATPFIEALPPVIKQVGDTASQVAGAVADAVVKISGAFGDLVTVIADAVSQIVQSVGTTLCQVFETAGDAIGTVVDSISGGIAEVVDAISGGFAAVLDSISGIIESIGTSAKNAGEGFKSVAEGISIIAGLSLLDIAKSLGAVAAGIGEISSSGSSLPSVAEGMRGIVTALLAMTAGQAVIMQIMKAGAAAPQAAEGFSNLAGAIQKIGPAGVGAIVAAGSLSKLVASAAIAGAAVAGLQAKLAASGTAVQKLAAGLSRTAGAAKSIAGGARSAQSAVSGIARASASVQSGLARLGNVAVSAMARLTSAFSAGASRAQSTGKKIGDGVQNGVKNGLSKLPSMATQAMSRFHSAFSSGGAKAVATAKRVGSSIASALRSAHSSVYSAGRYIGQGLVNGLSSMLGRVRSAAAKIAAAVDKAVQAKAKIGSPSKVMIRNGRYIGMGLAIGVGREQSAVYAAGTRLAVAASLGITDEAEIHSPSRKAMRHGANVGKGFANGLLSSFKTVQTSSKRLAKTAFQSLQSITGGKKGSFSSTATKVGKTYEKSLTANLNDQLPKTKKRLNKLVKKNKGLKKTLNTVYDQYSKYLKQGSDKAISETKDRLDELGDAYQKKYEAFRDRLRDYGDLFTADKYGYVSLKNFDEMTKQMKALGTNLEKLKGWGVSQSLMEEIAGMDTASALTMTNELLNRGKTAAQAYGKSYDKAMSTAASVSDKFYQSYFNADVEKELGSLQTKLTSIGKNAMEGFIKGMKSKTKSLKGASKSLANSVIGIFKKYLKIHSPSKVFAELGRYVGQGFANGMESTGRMIERVAADVISIPAGAPPSLALAGGGQLSPDYDYYDTDREYTIVSVLDVDGREFARATAPYTQRELNKLQTRDSRKRGVR